MPYKINERVEVKRVNDDVIIERISAEVNKLGVNLSLHQGLFYLLIVEHALKVGKECKDGRCVLMTIEEFQNLSVGISKGYGKTFVTKTLQLFTDANIIKREYLSKEQRKAIFGEGIKGVDNCKLTTVYSKYYL